MTLLKVADLQITFRTRRGIVTAVDGVSFEMAATEIVGLVGESGSGKSVTSRSIMGLISQPPGRVTGSIQFNDQELIGQSPKAWQQLRGKQIALILQDPMTTLNPVYAIGEQVAEGLRYHQKLSRFAARQRVLELFQQVGLAAPELFRAYPHQLSGGMRQRVIIAMSIACNPSLLIADEPTTALDVMTQAQILDLLQDLNRRGMGLLLITHDLSIVAQVCQRVLVMYAGRIVEQVSIAALFASAPKILHPYTLGLLQSTPSLSPRLQPIPGSPPDLAHLPTGCAFHPRCAFARDRCRTESPLLRELHPGHSCACHFAETLPL